MRTRMESNRDISSLIESIHDQDPVSGFTHTYYRYPARFSPKFAAAAIELFTEPGDVVYDPFMGGGTTLVEVMRLHRRGIGTDLNSLAVFVSNTKTTIPTNDDISALRHWVKTAQSKLKLTKQPNRPVDWILQGYQKNISSRNTWPIRKIIEIALAEIDSLENDLQRNLVRCLLLKTAQWAVDCRRLCPSVGNFRKQLIIHSEEMINGALKLREEFENASLVQIKTPLCLHLSAKDIVHPKKYPFSSAPKLILTSPPYPGVHVLYHRWQVRGRKETPAPYWIVNCLDGNGASYYTFGDRKQKRLEGYYKSMKESYNALFDISDEKTWLVQLVAFSEPEWQLPLFLTTLEDCGFYEVRFNNISHENNVRTWRTVPNRKFYASKKGHLASSKEFLLVHKRTK